MTESLMDSLNTELADSLDKAPDVAANGEESFTFEGFDLIVNASVGHARIEDVNGVIERIETTAGESPHQFTRRAIEMAEKLAAEVMAADLGRKVKRDR